MEEIRWIPEREIVVRVIALMGTASPPMKNRMFPDSRNIVVFPFRAKIRNEDKFPKRRPSEVLKMR